MLVFRTPKQRQEFERQALPYLDALYSMALHLTKNEREAEDLVQDSLVKAYRFFHRFEEGTNIKAWLFKVMVNTFYNTCRKNRKNQRIQGNAEIDLHYELFLSEATMNGHKAEGILLDNLVLEKLQSAIEELPEEFRTAVLLCDLHELSYKDIAEILNCPVGTIMSRLYRGRKLLQKKLYAYAVEQGYIREKSSSLKQAAVAGMVSDEPTDLASYRQLKMKRSGAGAFDTND